MIDITTVTKIRDELDINIEHVMLMGNLFDREAGLLKFANAVEKSQQAEIQSLNALVDKQVTDYNQLGIMFKVACDALTKQGITIQVEGKSISDYFKEKQ